MCRVALGIPVCAVCRQTSLPVDLSKHITNHDCWTLSSAAFVFPPRPNCNLVSPSLETAVAIKTRSPTITGQECPDPGIGDFHKTDLSPSSAAFHFVAVLKPIAAPVADLPRKLGQSVSACCALAADPKNNAKQAIVIANRNGAGFTAFFSCWADSKRRCFVDWNLTRQCP